MEERNLLIENKAVKNAFTMANYMYLYNTGMEGGMSILIPEEKRNGEGELEYKPESPKSP
jgi:hypothetical protein